MRSEELFARQLCRVLDGGARDLDASISERLRAARERALAHQVCAVETAEIVDAGGTALRMSGGHERHPVRMALSILALLLGVVLTYYWNAFDEATTNEEIDSALLADDLPPNAYLDKGFHAWLEKNARSSE